MKILLLASLILMLLVAGCTQASQSSNPAWVNKLIQKFEADPVGNPPLSITSYTYNSQPVYFVPAHCCDIPSVVYDATGNLLCSPDGGLSGKGDGKCPDFFTQRTNEQLIWQDSRTK